MKNYLLFPVFWIMAIPSVLSQFVDDIRIEDIKEEYIQIYSGGMTGRKIHINLDYGQLKIQGDDQRIKDADGKPLQFNSMMHAINYMKEFGFELFEAYSYGSDDKVYASFILRKNSTLSQMDK